jgi:hypothetical protein
MKISGVFRLTEFDNMTYTIGASNFGGDIMVPSYRLVMHSGPLAGRAFPMEKTELFIGRDLSNDIVINDPEVSRRHARMFLQGSNFVIEDLGSTNGTAVNGQRLLGPYILRPGETVVFGEHITAVFEATQPESGSTVVSAPPPQAQPRSRPAPASSAGPGYGPPPPPYAQPVGYVGQVPGVEDGEMMPERRVPVWVLVLGAILLLACVCIAFLVIVDVTYSWCWLFGWLFNMFSPGLCP